MRTIWTCTCPAARMSPASRSRRSASSSPGPATARPTGSGRPSLLLQDGTTVSTNAYATGITSSDSDPAANFDISYEYKTGTYSRRFLPLSDIAAVIIEDMTITIAE